MQRISPVNEVLSLFGYTAPATDQPTANHSLLVSVIGAFLIVVAVSAALGWYTARSTVAASGMERVAFQPGQFISQQLHAGYIGSYR